MHFVQEPCRRRNAEGRMLMLLRSIGFHCQRGRGCGCGGDGGSRPRPGPCTLPRPLRRGVHGYARGQKGKKPAAQMNRSQSSRREATLACTPQNNSRSTRLRRDCFRNRCYYLPVESDPPAMMGFRWISPLPELEPKTSHGTNKQTSLSFN